MGSFTGSYRFRPDGSFEESQYVDGFKNGHSFDKKANGTIQESKIKAGKPNGDVIQYHSEDNAFYKINFKNGKQKTKNSIQPEDLMGEVEMARETNGVQNDEWIKKYNIHWKCVL